tara:strand:- start:702 stop:1226 length:525 start_codon:yes stop_codon:yes gene_type:complete
MVSHIHIEISYIDADSTTIPNASPTIRQAIKAAMAETGHLQDASVEISVVVANDHFLQGLNKKYRKLNRPTNVLAFPINQENQEKGKDFPIVLGDIVLSIESVLSEAIEQRKTASAHLCHLVIHGLLHLLGYDHATSSEADLMETTERKVLSKIGIGDPYANASDSSTTAQQAL